MTHSQVPPLTEGQEVTVLQLGRVTWRYRPDVAALLTGSPYPYAGDPGVTVLPGDVRAILAQALSEAADSWEPARCKECAEAPQACEGCRGDEAKVRLYRSLCEALGGLEPDLGEAGRPCPPAQQEGERA